MIFIFLLTDESDYSLTEALLTFRSGAIPNTMICTTLYIIPDNMEEIDEEMIVHIMPIAPDILYDHIQQNISVTILNDDGRYNHRDGGGFTRQSVDYNYG